MQWLGGLLGSWGVTCHSYTVCCKHMPRGPVFKSEYIDLEFRAVQRAISLHISRSMPIQYYQPARPIALSAMPNLSQIFLLKCFYALLSMVGCSPPGGSIPSGVHRKTRTAPSPTSMASSQIEASAEQYQLWRTTEEELSSVETKAVMEITKTKAATHFSHSIP